MGKILTAFLFIQRAWKEPSTHAAISAIFTSLGVSFPETLIGHWLTLLAIPFGIAGIWLKEVKPETKVELE
jgi:hypothetical protein